MMMPEFVRLRLLAKMREVMVRRPDFAPGPEEAPFLQRWWLMPPSARGNIWLHRFLQSDQDAVPHDHAFHSLSLVLDEGYWEQTERGKIFRAPGAIVLRKATAPHRVLIEGKPAISIFITGRTFRQWGFQTEDGWLSAKDVEKYPAASEQCYGIKFWKNPNEERKAKP